MRANGLSLDSTFIKAQNKYPVWSITDAATSDSCGEWRDVVHEMDKMYQGQAERLIRVITVIDLKIILNLVLIT